MIIIDTGPLVAILNKRDSYHRWAVEKAAKCKAPLFTCEAVLTESYFLLQGVPLGLDGLSDLAVSGQLELSFSYTDHISRVNQLMDKYRDRPMSFADACLVSMAEEKKAKIFTLDSDFEFYRIHRNTKIELINP